MPNKRITKILGTRTLKKIAAGSAEYRKHAAGNCENMVGTVSIPVGVAGPLLIRGKYAKGKYVLPLATTEGALVASINRGAKVITESGGAKVWGEKIGISRAPVFLLKNTRDGKKWQEWFLKNVKRLQKAVQETSSHLRLLRVETQILPFQKKYLFVKFWFDAADAMGMNMATIATAHLVESIITPQTGLCCIALSSNWCADKKPATAHLSPGRGFHMTAQAILSKAVVHKILKTTPEHMCEVAAAKLIYGSVAAGSIGANAHHANTIAALYLATGQDPAHIVEGSHGITTLSVSKKQEVVVTVTLSAVICGVIGGGTHLPKQNEALALLGVLPNPKKPGMANAKFAEIIAAAVLAGEISLLAALASNDLSNAHLAARKRKDRS